MFSELERQATRNRHSARSPESSVQITTMTSLARWCRAWRFGKWANQERRNGFSDPETCDFFRRMTRMSAQRKISAATAATEAIAIPTDNHPHRKATALPFRFLFSTDTVRFALPRLNFDFFGPFILLIIDQTRIQYISEIFRCN